MFRVCQGVSRVFPAFSLRGLLGELVRHVCACQVNLRMGVALFWGTMGQLGALASSFRSVVFEVKYA